jgi:uncharacterized BrkB/YihY/UPF0761 family membrane protein
VNAERATKTDLLRARAASARAAIDRTAAGASLRRARDIDLGSCALVLAAQQLMATIPLLVVLSALRPVGNFGNFGTQLSWYLGLSPGAARELDAEFAARAEVRGAVTVVGLIVVAFFALGVAQAHQRAYELAWRLGEKKARAWRRRGRWVCGLIGYVALLAIAGRVIGHRSDARAIFILICGPVTVLFYWWSPWVLLARRVPKRALIPGAVMIALAVTGLLLLTPWVISGQVTSSDREFGPIGVTLVLASWLLIFSMLVVAGTVAGATTVSRREREGSTCPPRERR